MTNNSLPSPEYTGDSDSDSDIAKELEQKRRQLDEDIARFKIQKNKEFKDFETELKSRRRLKRAQLHQSQSDSSYYQCSKHSPSTTPPHKSLLSPDAKSGRPPHVHHVRQSSGSILLIKPTAGSKVTTPTISLDPTNIRGETIQQSYALPTPPTPSAVPSSTTQEVISSIDQSKARPKPPLSSEEHHEPTFNGVFVPSYLPLLGPTNDRSSDKSSDNLEGTQTEPASPVDRLTVDSMSVHASSLPTESSIPKDFHVPTSKRSYTSPTGTRARLAPIIRSSSGKKRSSGKRKHVTFQLADRAIVEPSSSYEEGPSPDVDEKDSNDSTRSVTPESGSPRPPVTRRNTPLDPYGRRKKPLKPTQTSLSEIGMGMGDLLLNATKEESEFLPAEDINETQIRSTSIEPEEGYFSPKHGTTVVNPVQQIAAATETSASEERDFFTGVDDDAYLNKRRELIKQRNSERKDSNDSIFNSKPLSETRPTTLTPNKAMSSQQRAYPGSLDDSIDGAVNVGFFELDEELASPDAGIPKPYEIATTEEGEDAANTKSKRQNKDQGHLGDMLTGTSVPIDIVRPGNSFVSNSWIGTFGH